MTHNYIDLGLPSGTYWATKNAVKDGKEHFTYDEALKAFGKNLPDIEKWKELIDKCSWAWDDYRKGCTVTGPNGNSIFLPAAGYHLGASAVITGKVGCYWSASPFGDDSAGHVYFYSEELHYSNNDRCYGFSIRLVREISDNLEKQEEQKPVEDAKVNAIKRVLEKRRNSIETLLEKNPDHPDKKHYEGKMEGYDQAIELLGESLESISIEL